MPKKASSAGEADAEIQAYCVKCKATKSMKDVKKIVDGKRARMAGVCTTCGTKMSKFVKQDTK